MSDVKRLRARWQALQLPALRVWRHPREAVRAWLVRRHGDPGRQRRGPGGLGPGLGDMAAIGAILADLDLHPQTGNAELAQQVHQWAMGGGNASEPAVQAFAQRLLRRMRKFGLAEKRVDASTFRSEQIVNEDGETVSWSYDAKNILQSRQEPGQD